jgi:hypothetical protein
LVLLVLVALGGLLVAAVIQGTAGIHVRNVAVSATYGKGITTLLAIGLFASVYGISRKELRGNAWRVLAAVSLGVAGKAFLTGGIMVLAYGGAGYLLLGVAVAQIDPLSVAASIQDYRMSERAKALLLAWASFDDPVTILLVAYLASLLPAARLHGAVALALTGGESYLWQVALNSALVLGAGLAWYLLAVRARLDRTFRGTIALCAILAGLIAVAVSFGLLIGIGLCGLFFRPQVERLLSHVVNLAFYTAAFLLGMLLVTGVDVPAGLLLGATVFTIQLAAGWLIGHGLPRGDRAHLVLGQQNGLTAIALALALAPFLSEAVGIIAVAVLTVNIIHIVSISAWNVVDGRSQPVEGKSQLLANPSKPRLADSGHIKLPNTAMPSPRP